MSRFRSGYNATSGAPSGENRHLAAVAIRSVDEKEKAKEKGTNRVVQHHSSRANERARQGSAGARRWQDCVSGDWCLCARARAYSRPEYVCVCCCCDASAKYRVVVVVVVVAVAPCVKKRPAGPSAVCERRRERSTDCRRRVTDAAKRRDGTGAR